MQNFTKTCYFVLSLNFSSYNTGTLKQMKTHVANLSFECNLCLPECESTRAPGHWRCVYFDFTSLCVFHWSHWVWESSLRSLSSLFHQGHTVVYLCLLELMVYPAPQLHRKMLTPLVNGGTAGMWIISGMAAFTIEITCKTMSVWLGGMTVYTLLSPLLRQLENFGPDADLQTFIRFFIWCIFPVLSKKKEKSNKNTIEKQVFMIPWC